MLALFAISVPVSFAIGIASLVGLYLFTNLPGLLVAQQLFTNLDRYPLAAIPFFILAGNLMDVGGISRRLVDVAKAMVGGVQGGLGIACVLTCMMFAAVSGSSVATTFAIGAILIPAMVRHGYPAPFAGALQATAAELGVIIPPSIPMILYAVSAEVSVGEMFIAGIGPGLLIAASLAVGVYVLCKIKGLGKRDGEEGTSLGKAIVKAWAALMMPVVVIGGIYGGVFTPTEASAVAVVYAVLVGGFVYRELNWKDLPAVVGKSAVASVGILFIIANAGLFSFLINRAEVPQLVAQWLTSTIESPLGFLMAVNAFLFVLGMFVETSASIIVIAPILAPIAQHFGIDLIHFGLVMVVNLALGMITPPFGVNLFAACQVAKIRFDEIVRPLGPFILIIVLNLAIVTYFPAVSLTFRDLLY
jgi:tripartite ATP-independent transporter DctM subunit